MEPEEKKTRIQKLLAKVRERGDSLIDKGFEAGVEAGYPDLAAGGAALATAAEDMFLPADEADLAMAAIPGGSLLKGAKKLKKAVRAEEVLEDGAKLFKEVPTLDYKVMGTFNPETIKDYAGKKDMSGRLLRTKSWAKEIK